MRCVTGNFRRLAVLCLLSLDLNAYGQEKIALLIGIGDYPAYSGWPSTNAYNDVNLLRESLMQKGFGDKDIHTLLDTACTLARLRNTFKKEFISSLKEGMFVYLHFSGLAQQIHDLEGDEADGFDEAFVPYDAPEKEINASYDPELFLRDDELESYFLLIRKKIGLNGQLLVTVDASTAPYKLADLTIARGSLSNEYEFFTIADGTNKNLAPIIQMYSSSLKKLNDEYYSEDNEYYGLFTYALCKSLFQLDPKDNYNHWFESIGFIISEQSKRQTPVLSGYSDALPFNGKLTNSKPYFSLKKRYSRDLVLIDGGKWQGLEKGTEFIFYEGTVEDTFSDHIMARGIAEQISLLETEVRLLQGSGEIPNQAKVFVSSYHYKPLAGRVRVDLPGTELESTLVSHFSFSTFIIQDKIRPELTISKNHEDELILKNRKGEILYRQKWHEIKVKELPFVLNETIASYLRANFLRSLEIDLIGQKPKIECLLVEEGIERAMDVKKDNLKAGTLIKLRITNTSDRAQYFSIFDIQPDDNINVLIPHDKPSESYFLGAGESYTTDFEIEITPPLGKEFIKVLMTPEPLDLRPVFATQGVSLMLGGNLQNPLETLVGNTFVEHPITTNRALKLNVADLGSLTGLELNITELQ